jgi:hypothetical protein
MSVEYLMTWRTVKKFTIELIPNATKKKPIPAPIAKIAFSLLKVKDILALN